MKTSVNCATIVLLFFLISCGSKKQESIETLDPVVVEAKVPAPESVPYKELSGYFLNNSYDLKSEVNLIIAQTDDQMSLAFGIGKTMNNKIDKVNFTTDAAIGVAIQPTDRKTDVKIDRVEKQEGILKVYVTVVQGEKQTFKTTPVVLLSFPKNSGVKQVEVFSNGEKKDSKSY